MKNNIRKIALLALLVVSTSGFTATSKKADKDKTAVRKNDISVQDQRKFDYFFYEAVRQRQLGKLSQAVDLLTECYYINPKNSAVAYEFGMAYTSIQDVPHAMQFMALASRLDPTNGWYKIAFAELCIKNSDYKTAILVYEDIAKNHPDQDDVDYMLASLYKQTGDLKKSIQALDKVEQRLGVNESVSYEKFKMYDALGKKKQSFEEIDKLIKKFPYEPKYKLLRASIYLNEKQPEKALKIYDQLKAQDPNNSLLLTARYDYYRSMGDSAKAYALYTEAFANKDISIDEKIGLLTQFLSAENQSVVVAESYFKQLLALYPENEIIHSYYASFLLMMKRSGEAKIELQSILKINPKDKEAWIELMQIWVDQADFEQLLVSSNEAISNLPDDSGLYLFKGIALTQLKRSDEAIETYKMGISKTIDDEVSVKAEYNMQIADILAERKNMSEAFDYYEKAYQLNPNNAALLNNYAYYLSLEGKDLSKAEKMSAKTVEAYPNNVSFLDTYAWIFFKENNLILAKMYVEQAIDKGGDKSAVVIEHYGDILYQSGDKDEALSYWQKSKELGNDSKILDQKIETKTYIPETK